MPGIGLITNPRSRQNLKDPSRPRKLGHLIGSHGTAQATRSLDDLYRVCEDFKKERIEVLGISGGDGTLHHTLTAALRTWGDEPLPPIAILRGGTMNTVANSLGIHGGTADLLFELVDKERRGLLGTVSIIERPVLAMATVAAGAASALRYGFIFGNGIIYNFLDAYYSTGHPSPTTAARLITAAAASTLVRGPLSRRIYRRFKARVTVDGERWAREDFIAVAAATVGQIGLGFTPFYRCAERPDGFALLGIHTSAAGFVAELPAIWRGRPMRRDKVIDQVAREVLFEPLEDGGHLEYIIDGDTYVTEGALRITTGPRLRFLQLSGDATSADGHSSEEAEARKRLRQELGEVAAGDLPVSAPP